MPDELMPSRERMKVLVTIFDRFMLKDQQAYYKKAIEKYRGSAMEVIRIQAGFALLGGLVSAAVGLLEAIDYNRDEFVLPLVFIAVIAPGISAAFASLNSLFQWDRMATLYEDTLNSIYMADAMSPQEELVKDHDYYLQLMAFVDSTLNIMQEETGQFGAMVRSSQQIDQFVEKQRDRAETVTNRYYAPPPSG
jgi:hypothetical protein